MRKGTLVILAFLIFRSLSYGQYTASLPNMVASPNENIGMDLNVTGLNTNNIASIQFYIQIDPAVLTFQNVTNFQQAGLMVGFINGNTITIVWTSGSPKNFPNGRLLTLNFKYNGLTSPVSFIPLNCEVVKLVGSPPIPVMLTGTFNNGSVSPFMGNQAKARLDSLLNAPLGTDTVSLKYTGFIGNNLLPLSVGAITQRISYDQAKLTFVGVTGVGNLATGFNVNVAAGIITITWTSVAGKNINYPGNMFKIIFSYINASPTNVNFSTGCIIETTAPVTNIVVSYFNGCVIPPPVVTSYASIANVTGGIQGQTVDVPLNFSSMPTNTSNFNLNISFDSPKLSFVGIVGTPIQPVTYNVNGNLISLTNAYPLTPNPSINGQFLKLRFVYMGVGTANVNFASGCQFSNGAPIGVGYTNGSVSPAVVLGNNVTIGTIAPPGPGTVLVPVTLSEMPINVGAVTMFIGFDASKLIYTGCTGINNPYAANVNLNGGIIKIAWASTNPPNLNGSPFVNLQFTYVCGSGASGSAARVYFTDNGISEYCRIDSLSGKIIPSNWHDGGVNLNVTFKISGTLKYNSDPNLRIPLVGYTVKLLTIGDVLVTSTVTDGSGYFEFFTSNGSFKLDAAPPSIYNYYSDLDDVLAMLQYTVGEPIPFFNDLRLLAGDVNQNGDIDLDDVVDVLQRGVGEKLPDYTAPDWVFSVKLVNCSCADVPNQNFMGLNTGNVLGTNPTP